MAVSNHLSINVDRVLTVLAESNLFMLQFAKFSYITNIGFVFVL